MSTRKNTGFVVGQSLCETKKFKLKNLTIKNILYHVISSQRFIIINFKSNQNANI